jgi:hypothetical protein
MSIPLKKTARIVTPQAIARPRCPISQYPSPGKTHPASATTGGEELMTTFSAARFGIGSEIL